MSPRLQKKTIKYAIPFFLFVFGGAACLRELRQIRYDYHPLRRNEFLDMRKELENDGLVIKKMGEVTLESEYEKYKELDLDDWENKRIYRPWEHEDDSNETTKS